MWKTYTKLISPTLQNVKNLLGAENVIKDQIRTTYILKRKHEPLLHKKGHPPKKLKAKHFIYEMVKNTASEKQPNLDLILTNFVEGLGKAGEKVSVKANYGYNHLLLTGLAVYANPENLEKYKDYANKSSDEEHSSPTAQMTANTLSKMTLSVVMNKEHSWTLQPWHVRASFRKCGFIVPVDAITLPEEPIKGPDMSLQGKEFYFTVTINNLEKAKVRCLIHHWSTDVINRVQHEHEFWKKPAGSMLEANLSFSADGKEKE